MNWRKWTYSATAVLVVVTAVGLVFEQSSGLLLDNRALFGLGWLFVVSVVGSAFAVVAILDLCLWLFKTARSTSREILEILSIVIVGWAGWYLSSSTWAGCVVETSDSASCWQGASIAVGLVLAGLRAGLIRFNMRHRDGSPRRPHDRSLNVDML